MTPEFQLLCRCCHTRLDAGRIAAVRRLLQEPVAFDELLRLAQRHGVVPLLYQSLSALGTDLVPDPVLARLHAHSVLNLSLNRALAAELPAILHLLDNHQVPALPFKGPLLAQTVYGSLALRKAGDLDLLLRRGDALPAATLLQAAGYTLDDSEQDELRLKHTSRHTVVELRWSLASPHFLTPLGFDFFWPSRVHRILNGSSVPGLPPEEDLLILCVHGARHCWSRLLWICDLAELLRAFPGLDGERLRHLARRAGVSRAVTLGLILAQNLLGADLPPSLRAACSSRGPQLIAQAVETHIGAPTAASTYLDHCRRRTFDPALLDSFPHRFWRGLCRICRKLPPNERDMRLLPLPPRYRFLLYLVRPLRLVAEFLSPPRRA